MLEKSTIQYAKMNGPVWDNFFFEELFMRIWII
jgi:hypothetical protein